MKSSVVIVNYRTAGMICNCLVSLSSQLSGSVNHLLIVDNNSSDGSVERLAAVIDNNGWQRWVTILPQEINGGFAAGNNAAIKYLMTSDVPPDAVMLLNPDTVIHPGAIGRLIRFLIERPEVGIVGAQLVNGNNVFESSSRRYPSLFSELDDGARLGLLSNLLKDWQVPLPVVDHAHQCDWVSGAAMMIRREVLEQIGLLDEGFFLYFEELDFCQRAGNAGWQIWLEPAAKVTHFEGQSTGIQKARQRRGKYWYDSRRRYFIKHLGMLRWIAADLLWGVGRLSLLLRTRLNLGGDISSDPLCYTRDLLWGDFRAFVSGEAWKTKRSATQQDQK